MKPINTDKERIIVLMNQMLTRANLSIDQVVARMQIDGCSLTRNTFENRFTTRVHQKPNIPEEWLLSLARVLRSSLAESEKCKAVEILELCRLARFPLHKYGALEALFPAPEFTAAIEQIFPLSYFSVSQNAIGAAKSPSDSVSHSSVNQPNRLGKSPIIRGHPPLGTPVYGFEEKIRILAEWIGREKCQLVTILGMGGSGKSSLAAQVMAEIQMHFDYVIWFSMQETPSFAHFMDQLTVFLAENLDVARWHAQSQSATQTLPQTLKEQRHLLFSYLQNKRLFIVLDGFEVILESGESTGAYRIGFEQYGTWLQQFVELTGHSCVLVTSREKPLHFPSQNDTSGVVRSMTLGGLDLASTRKLLKQRALSGSDGEWIQLHEQYAGNPLMLKLAAEPIVALFDGVIGRFLAHNASLFQEVRQLMEQQFGRLTLLERELLYWLLIEREATTIDVLQEDIGETVPRLQLLEALHALWRRSLVEQIGNRFTISKIVQTYLSERLIELIVSEIDAEMPLMLTSFALLKVQSKEHLRDCQLQTIIRPILERLLRFSGHTEIVQKLLTMLTSLRFHPSPQTNYGAGNLLNLLGQLNVDLRGQDFSGLEICQADLRTMNLQDVNFSNATFRSARFWESFTSISALAYSSEGQYIAAGMTNGEIHLWSLKHEELRYRLVGHQDMVWDIVFSPDGQLLATACEDATVRLWELASGECLHELTNHNDWVKSISFLHDGTQLVTAGHDAMVRIWDVQNGECLQQWQAHTNWIWSVSVSPDSRLLATASHDHTVKLWEIATGHCLYSLSGHTEPVRTVAFSPDGRQLMSASFDHTIRLWDVARGEQTQLLRGHENLIWSAAYSPDGRCIASGGDDAQIFFWNVADGSHVCTTQGHQNRLWALAFHPNGDVVASGGDDQRLRFWSVSDGEPLRQLSGYSSQVWSLATHPTLPLLASGGDDGTVRLWAHHAGVVEQLLQGHNERIRSVAFHSDGRLLATGGDDQVVRIWDVQRNVTVQTLVGHQNRVWGVAFTADQTRLVSCSEDQTIRLWKPESGQLVRTLYTEGGRIWSIACHPMQALMASSGDRKEILLWDLKTGACIDAWEGHEDRIWTISYDQSGAFLVSGSADHTVIIWDSATGTIRHRLEGHQSAVWAVAFSPDGQWLASSGDDRYICIWHVPSGTLRRTLYGHTGCVWSLAFVTDTLLASGGQDEVIRLWDIASGQALDKLQGERPYERMRITGVQGLSEAQKASLCMLGAVEN